MFQIGGGVAVPMGDWCELSGKFDFRHIFAEGEGINSFVSSLGVRLGR